MYLKRNNPHKLMTIVFMIMVVNTFSQGAEYFKENRMVSVTIDGSRLIEDPENFDSGLNIVGTLVISRKSKVEPIVRFEAFPNIKYYKFGIGGNYVIPWKKRNGDRMFEFAGGVEAGIIFRENIPLPENHINGSGSMSGWLTYGFNGEIRWFVFQRLPFIMSYNHQRRTDWYIYGENAKIEFVGSAYFGLAWIF